MGRGCSLRSGTAATWARGGCIHARHLGPAGGSSWAPGGCIHARHLGPAGGSSCARLPAEPPPLAGSPGRVDSLELTIYKALGPRRAAGAPELVPKATVEHHSIMY